ncbi:MAG: YbaB/EbfC family nucleoid-associated protein [Calditrichaeota bacterium]|nr:YbaB/EbfC family nucleoid-associated protein [Calditrichota bacterium]
MLDMNNILKQAQKFQEEMQKVQETLSSITVEGSSGGGMVKVVANCKLEVISVKIDPEVLKEDDQEMIEDLIVAAVNQAIQTAQKRAEEEMKKATGGMLGNLNLPNNFKLPGM